MSDEIPPHNNYSGTPVATFKQRVIAMLPEVLRDQFSGLEKNLPAYQSKAQTHLQGAQEFLGPLWQELQLIIRSVSKKIAVSGPMATVGGTFKHLCFVGLNRAELLMSGESQGVFNDSWADLTGDNIKRSTGLLFFAPRGLDGKPVNPYLFLVGEGIPDDAEMADPNMVALAEQSVGGMALLDLCRLSPAAPNTVNMLLVADTLFHWDVKDNYVLPTTPTSWVRDVEMVLKSYPRTTRAHLFTQWDTDLLPPTDRIIVHSVRDMPLDDETWLNKPTLQERYGNHMLVIGLIVAALAYAVHWKQASSLQEVTDQLNVIEQQIPRGGQFSDLERAISEQEKMWAKRDLFGVVVKDTGRAIQKSGMKVVSFEVRVADPENPPKNYVINIDAQPNAYQGWLQQEPIARSLILNSAVLDAIRKPPTTTGFKLEGLVDANALAREYKPYAAQPKVVPQMPSSTTPVSSSLPKSASLPGSFSAAPLQRGVEPAAGRTIPSHPTDGGDE